MKIITVLLSLILGFMNFGCAATTGKNEQDIAKLTLQYATLKFIQDNPERASEIISLVDKTLDFVEQDAVVTPEELRMVLMVNLPQGLDSADKLLAESLVDLILLQVQDRARLPEDLSLEEVETILREVRAIALLVLQPKNENS